MVIFFKLFEHFRKNPHKQLEAAYSSLNALVANLQVQAVELRELQTKLVKQVADRGGMGLSKTLMIEEELVPRLNELAEKTEARYWVAYKTMEETEPVPPFERDEIKLITGVLRQVQEKFNNIGDISKKNPAEQLVIVETKLREVELLLKKFHEDQKWTVDMIKKLSQHEVSELYQVVKKVFTKTKKENVIGEDGKPVFLNVAYVSPKELDILTKESEEINKAQDFDNWKIEWRRWWREKQRPESDKGTGFQKKHINVDITYAGKPKKIHLVVQGA